VTEKQIILPTLHPGQRTILNNAARFNQVCCGRRWGKTFMLNRMASQMVANGMSVGIFTPSYKYQSEIYREVHSTLRPIKYESNKTEGIIRTITGGQVDFWSLENPEAGRGRKYHRVLIDEAAFAKDTEMQATWERAIEPTLLDYTGDAFAFSTPKGVNPDNWFYQVSQSSQWRKFRAPSSTNPYLPAHELEAIRERSHPQVWQQEFLAEFVDWSGIAFFRLDDMMPLLEAPIKVYGAIFAVIDSAIKTGSEHDGTGVIYCAIQPSYMYEDKRSRLVILDWDVRQISGDLLLTWYGEVEANLERLATETQAIHGHLGAFVEDKGSGTIMLQQAKRMGMSKIHSIESKLTSMGKDERALAASPYFSSGQVNLARHAHEKTVNYKGVTRNHLLTQLMGFRLGDKDAARRQDDLLDVATYGVIIGLGGSMGI
jgi:hypothetical protein